MMREYEKKRLLSEEQYRCVCAFFAKNDMGSLQINYYFDTDDLAMNQKGITCRVRYKDGVYQATMKQHMVEHTDLSVEIDRSKKKHFDPLVFSPLGLRLHGVLVTERSILYQDQFCEMVLDRNMYLGTVDYELEIEYKEGYGVRADILLENVQDVLRMYHCYPIEGSSVPHDSKSKRFFARKTMLEE